VILLSLTGYSWIWHAIISVRAPAYRFNIWNTDPDLNFDRIAHLAKLVFNTKGVLISLIDGNEQ
jgi:hypothetical protein